MVVIAKAGTARFHDRILFGGAKVYAYDSVAISCCPGYDASASVLADDFEHLSELPAADGGKFALALHNGLAVKANPGLALVVWAWCRTKEGDPDAPYAYELVLLISSASVRRVVWGLTAVIRYSL